MSTLLADYDTERQAFESLFQPDCSQRIVLFRGESGSGKTTLLQFCQEHVPDTIWHLPMQLRGSAVTVAEIFFRFGDRLSWKRLPAFTRQVASMESGPKVKIDKNWLAGINNSISVALQAESQADREHRRAALTGAWFTDLTAFDRPTLFIFDTYEQATTEVQDWLSGPFLARAAHVDAVRVVVAGQKVPDAHNIEWGHCCAAHDLYGVLEAKHWMPIVKAMRRRLDVRDPEVWLAGVCHALNGNPDKIMKVIEGLPREVVQ